MECTAPSVHRPALNVPTFSGIAMARLPAADACWVRVAAWTCTIQAEPCVVGSVAVNFPVLVATTLPSVVLPSDRKTRAPGKPTQVVPLRYCTAA